MFCSVRVDGLSRIVASCGESAAGEEEVRDSLGDGAGQAERGADDVNPSDEGVEVDMAAAELRDGLEMNGDLEAHTRLVAGLLRYARPL